MLVPSLLPARRAVFGRPAEALISSQVAFSTIRPEQHEMALQRRGHMYSMAVQATKGNEAAHVDGKVLPSPHPSYHEPDYAMGHIPILTSGVMCA